MKMLMYKVVYSQPGAKSPTHTALFTDRGEAICFEETLKATGGYAFVSLNGWTWEVEIEE